MQIRKDIIIFSVLYDIRSFCAISSRYSRTIWYFSSTYWFRSRIRTRSSVMKNLGFLKKNSQIKGQICGKFVRLNFNKEENFSLSYYHHKRVPKIQNDFVMYIVVHGHLLLLTRQQLWLVFMKLSKLNVNIQLLNSSLHVFHLNQWEIFMFQSVVGKQEIVCMKLSELNVNIQLNTNQCEII